MRAYTLQKKHSDLLARSKHHIFSQRDKSDSNFDADETKTSVFLQSQTSADSLIADRFDFSPRQTQQKLLLRTTDYVEAVKQEEEKNTKIEDSRLFKWQSIVFIIACLRLYMINAFSVTNGETAVSDEKKIRFGTT
jgi:hypothetical protein